MLRVARCILTSVEEFQECDSGWTLSRILNLAINVNKYNLLHVRCYIELPWEIIMKRAVINVQFMANACFAWSVVAVLHSAEKKPERKSSYPYYTIVLNLRDIEFSMTLNQIKKFENNIKITFPSTCITSRRKRKSRSFRFGSLIEKWTSS